MTLPQPAAAIPLPRSTTLAPPARLVLAATRAWFAAGGPAAALCVTFAHAGLPAAATARFAAALAIIGTAARRALDMRAPDSAGLSRDEGLLLIALAALQAGQPWRAQRAVAEWLPGPLMPRAIAALAAVAATLASAGLRLPREPVDESALPPAWRPHALALLH